MNEYIFFFLAIESSPPTTEIKDPCYPSPCGPNSQCLVSPSGSSQCTCLPAFIGSPPYCRPECVSNSDCSPQLSCIQQKCKDPCPGSCGINAECHVVSHTPNCICLQGYTGDPFTMCNKQCKQTEWKHVYKFDRYIDNVMDNIILIRIYC